MSSGFFSSASTLIEIAKDISAACEDIPEAMPIAEAIGQGQGDAGKIEDAAQAWRDASKQIKQAHQELQNLVGNIPDSEWKATSRELYEQKAKEYLQQLETSSTAAEVAGDALTAAASAIAVFADFSMGIATVLAADAAIVAAADATVVGAPEGEAEAASVGAALLAAMETANTVLTAALAAVAAVFGAGAFVDAGVQVSEGDTSAIDDFGQAVIQGAGDAVKTYIDSIKDGGGEGKSKEGESGTGENGATTEPAPAAEPASTSTPHPSTSTPPPSTPEPSAPAPQPSTRRTWA